MYGICLTFLSVSDDLRIKKPELYLFVFLHFGMPKFAFPKCVKNVQNTMHHILCNDPFVTGYKTKTTYFSISFNKSFLDLSMIPFFGSTLIATHLKYNTRSKNHISDKIGQELVTGYFTSFLFKFSNTQLECVGNQY